MVSLTPKAAEMLKEMLKQYPDKDYALRVQIVPGGCSGFQYQMVFDDEIKDDDVVFEHNGVKVVVDPVSYQFVQGAEIDFVDGLMGRGFTVRNPNATATCGCGHSFSV